MASRHPRRSTHAQPPAAGDAAPAPGRAFRAKAPVFRFVGLFILIVASYYLLAATTIYRDGFFPRYLALNASASAVCLRALGENATSSGEHVGGRYSLAIKEGCDAIEPAVLFGAAVLAFPVAWRRRLVGVALGFPALILLNLARIISLYYIGIYWNAAFETFHVYVWQPAFIVLALAGWLLWALWATKPIGATEPGAAR